MYCVSSDDKPIIISNGNSEEEVEELSGSELDETMWKQRLPDVTLQPCVETDACLKIICESTWEDLEKAESSHSLGYYGWSAWTKRCHEQLAWEKEKGDANLRNRQ